MGCISQVTATSIVGGYTEEIRQTAYQMMQENLIHVIASDAHDTVARPYNLTNALERVQADFGKDYANYLVQNADRIFSGEKVNAFKK